MRYGLFFTLLLYATTSSADVFTCHTPSGQIVYSDLPCLKGETIDKISPSESLSDPAAAQRELERQKAYTERQAAENAKGRAVAPGPAILPDYSSPPPKWPPPTPLSPASTVPAAPPSGSR